MVDTGMGDGEAEGVGGEWGSLFNEMKANKVDAGDVDMVFMTHLHFDHTGWNVSRNGDAPAVLFPKAQVRGPRDRLGVFQKRAGGQGEIFLRSVHCRAALRDGEARAGVG